VGNNVSGSLSPLELPRIIVESEGGEAQGRRSTREVKHKGGEAQGR